MWAKVFLLFFVFSFLFRTDLSFDQDLGRHIKLGEIIVQTHQVPKNNLFSYTNPDFKYINTHWLFGVLAYFFASTGTLGLLLLLKVVIFLFAVWLTIKDVKSALLLPIGFIFFHVLRERLDLRPEIFSFLFTAITLFILEKFRQMSSGSPRFASEAGRGTFVTWLKAIYFLPLIQLIWVNTHIYFFIGLLLQAIFLIELGYQQIRSHLTGGKLKLLIIIFALSVLASLFNPNGLAGFLYPLNVTKNYGYTIAENQTIFLLESIGFTNPNFIFVKFAVGVSILSLLVAFWRRKFEPKNILLTSLPVAFALMNVRSFPYLAFLGLPAVLSNFGLTKFRLSPILTTGVCIILLLESFFYLNGAYYKGTDSQHHLGIQFTESVKGAMDFVLANDLPNPIYNNFDIGSYIFYRGFPKYEVFVDGRPEAYPKEFFQQIYIPSQSDFVKFKELEEKWGFKAIIFSHTDQTPWGKSFLQELFKDKSWKLVYIDNFMLVLVKEDVILDKKLEPVDLSKISPGQYKFTNHRDYLQLGLFLLSQNQASGVAFIQKAHEISPESPSANTILGQITNDPKYLEKTENIFKW